MDSIKEIKDYIEKNFSEKRKIHTEGVQTTAIELAKRYGADPQKAEIAALFHDMYRGVSENSLNYYVKHLGLDSKYLNNCNLAHGKIAAIIMQRDFEIEDPDIINAVSYHTTGRPGMSLLEKIIYIADAVEPNRSYPDVDEIRQMAKGSLFDTLCECLGRTMILTIREGSVVHPDTLTTWNTMKMRAKAQKEKVK